MIMERMEAVITNGKERNMTEQVKNKALVHLNYL